MVQDSELRGHPRSEMLDGQSRGRSWRLSRKPRPVSVLALAQCQAREGAAQCAHRNAGSSTKHPLRGRNAGIRRAWTLDHGRARQPSGRTRATPPRPRGGGTRAASASMNGYRARGCRPSRSRAYQHPEWPRGTPAGHPLPAVPPEPSRVRCAMRGVQPSRTTSTHDVSAGAPNDHTSDAETRE